MKGLFTLFHKHLSLVHDLVQCENGKYFLKKAISTPYNPALVHF